MLMEAANVVGDSETERVCEEILAEEGPWLVGSQITLERSPVHSCSVRQLTQSLPNASLERRP